MRAAVVSSVLASCLGASACTTEGAEPGAVAGGGSLTAEVDEARLKPLAVEWSQGKFKLVDRGYAIAEGRAYGSGRELRIVFDKLPAGSRVTVGGTRETVERPGFYMRELDVSDLVRRANVGLLAEKKLATAKDTIERWLEGHVKR